MKQSEFTTNPKVSASLCAMLGEANKNPGKPPVLHFRAVGGGNPGSQDPTVSLLVETQTGDQQLSDLSSGHCQRLSDQFVSLDLPMSKVEQLIQEPHVERIQTKRKHKLVMEQALEHANGISAGERDFFESGSGVYIGIVDSGFDLSHPAFYDRNGRLRVDFLLDQVGGKQEFDRDELEQKWTLGQGNFGPGFDSNGHGTHVAAIAGGTLFGTGGWEGVAPDARFLLVKTNMFDVDEGVKWIFEKAGRSPCVVNLSLGSHYGPHDGTNAEERLYNQLSGDNQIIVVAAGNEQEKDLHVGSWYFPEQSNDYVFDVLPGNDNTDPGVVVTGWYSERDQFDLFLGTPAGQFIPFPSQGDPGRKYSNNVVSIDVSRTYYQWSQLIQCRLELSFDRATVSIDDLYGWTLRTSSKQLTAGRFDAWFHNSDFARFRQHPHLEKYRTVGIPGTGSGTITVASFTSKTQWTGDQGFAEDALSLAGRLSRFSSLGPTRDGRWKPDIAAPGHMITSALADGSRLSKAIERTLVNQRAVTIEGTSMAAPFVSGVIALMLQKATASGKNLNPVEVKDLLAKSATKDWFTGREAWTPEFGRGKVNIPEVLSLI
ncbi:S8 family serine peptidase [Acanthopleuribacter pedis]|uniref:S8 family serine peptidase n=1 Tax=Acanthopleuribacter pedis TaxID=442870 RepID=A0A8J7QEX2_9BACT|nr:S8 family serine peptidase [Acanthopleuribacter pedis]MBO1321465.1 S8 family serine peptidase [Acanthopleuribacter pedis]